jgi:hypothetical protein
LSNILKRSIGILIIGFIVGFAPIYLFKTSQVTELKDSKIELTTENNQLTKTVEELQPLEKKANLLEAELSRLILTSASGGGVNVKLMPDPITKELTVKLSEVFSFNSGHAFCRVDTNHEAFLMPTFLMGDVLMEKNEFFMAMSTTSMDEFKLSKNSNGFNKIVISGELDCFTEVAKSTMKIGSKEIAEVANYRIEAIDGGVGGGGAGDTFQFTAYFDETESPINYAIFGPEFTFTGDMVDGEITILDPR